LIEQVIVPVNVGALASAKLATVARTLNLSRHTLSIKPIEFVADRSARLARRQWSCSWITISAGRTSAALERAREDDHKNNR